MRKGTKFTAIFGGLALIPVLSACGGSAGASGTSHTTPKTLVGRWVQSNDLDNDVIMKATVSKGNTIQVNMQARDSTSIYWLGSFKSNKNPRSSFNVISRGDQDAMSMSIFGSVDSTKRFKYKNGDLSFEFSMLGTTSTVHLKKQPDVGASTRTKTRPTFKNPAPKRTITKPAKVPAAPPKPFKKTK